MCGCVCVVERMWKCVGGVCVGSGVSRRVAAGRYRVAWRIVQHANASLDIFACQKISGYLTASKYPRDLWSTSRVSRQFVGGVRRRDEIWSTFVGEQRRNAKTAKTPLKGTVLNGCARQRAFVICIRNKKRQGGVRLVFYVIQKLRVFTNLSR